MEEQAARKANELAAASDHLYYEVQMARACAVGLASGLFPVGPLHDAVLESFVIHARNLVHFFFPQSAQASDVLAEHYFETPQEWNSLRGDLPPRLAPLRGRANKEVAHLTYNRLRVTPEEKSWHFLEIVADLNALLERFLRSAPRSHLSSRWSTSA
jgi:hypothetical protein